MKSQEYTQGFTDALVFVSDIFESHQKSFVRKGLFRQKDIKLIVNIIDACIRRREVLADIGSRKMNLFIGKDRSASLKEM